MRTMKLLKSQLPLTTAIAKRKQQVFGVERERLISGFLRSQVKLMNKDFGKFRSNHFELLTKETLVGEEYFTENYFLVTETAFTDTLG